MLHQQSDNAASHFKHAGALEYFTSLAMNCGGPAECMYVYSFGVPGHGKGPFNGLVGTIKHKIHNLINRTPILIPN